MEEIKNYVYMLVCVLAVSGLAINLSPEGEMKKYIRENKIVELDKLKRLEKKT